MLTSNLYESPPSCRINEFILAVGADKEFGDFELDDFELDDFELGDFDFDDFDLAVLALVETRCDISPFGSQRFVSLL